MGGIYFFLVDMVARAQQSWWQVQRVRLRSGHLPGPVATVTCHCSTPTIGRGWALTVTVIREGPQPGPAAQRHWM